ncbi:Bacteriophage replication protein O [compost metagenome]
MAGPELEDGYTRVANEIYEEVAMRKFNGIQLRMLLIVWRYTYGFKRKSAELSATFLATALRSDLSGIKKELKRLFEMNVLKVFRQAQGKHGRMIGFNKYSEQWLVGCNPPPQPPESDESTGGELHPLPVDNSPPLEGGNRLPKKERKKNIKKEEIEDMSPTPERIQFHDTVFLTQEQYEKLCSDFGKQKVDDTIEALDEWQSNKKKSQHKKDHNKTLRVWIKKDQAKAPVKTKQQRNQEEMSILNQFYEEGAAREANGNSQLPSGNQDGVPLL